ncbi:hypothetical protein [Rhodoferax sp. GW822-FHT02A01]|uniref:hypothetical protein n=1 Tax=Rhodoferax sp. GW822-FHT02A01 TaxID=3141537 RepID=UPI00315C7706
MFKITSITDALFAVVKIKHPVTKEDLGASITLAGPEHPARKAIEFAKQRKLRASVQKTGKLELGDPADDELDQIEKLTACTLGWDGITDDDGNVIEFSRSAAEKLYATEGLGWLRDQLTAAMGERERFIKA